MTNHPIHLSCVYTKKDVPFTYLLGDRIRYHHRQWGIIRYQENQHLSNAMGLLPDTQHCGLRTRRECENVFPANAGWRFRHASRHVRLARAVMHAGSLTSGFLWSWWRGKRSQNSRRMRNRYVWWDHKIQICPKMINETQAKCQQCV